MADIKELSTKIKALADEIGDLTSRASQATTEQAEMAQRIAAAQAQMTQLFAAAGDRAAQIKDLANTPIDPPVKGWGPGPRSKLPWHTGTRCQNPANVDKHLAVARPGRPNDMIQCFVGPAQAETWNDVAGGADDSLQKFDGVMKINGGQNAIANIWQKFPELDAVLTTRPIPNVASNRDGKNPKVWHQIAGGEFDWVYRRNGRKFAGLDGLFPRQGRLILEIAREFTGSWDQHSMVGAWDVFPQAWRKIVEQTRAGYREASGLDMPHLICIRPARSPVANGIWTETWLPDPEFWDVIGLSQHDNGWAPCTPDDPRRNWRRQGNAEGLENIAELAELHDKLLGFFEWSSHHAKSKNKSGPHPDIFTQSMWDFFVLVKARLTGECYFLSSDTTFAGNANWPAAKRYRQLWGAAA